MNNENPTEKIEKLIYYGNQVLAEKGIDSSADTIRGIIDRISNIDPVLTAVSESEMLALLNSEENRGKIVKYEGPETDDFIPGEFYVIQGV